KDPSPDAGSSTATADTSVGLASPWYYALFRAGVPADPDALFRVTPAAARATWQQAFAQGTMPRSLEGSIDAAVAAFATLCAARVLDVRPGAGVSTLREMLKTELVDPNHQAYFARAYVLHREDPTALWDDLKQRLDEPVIRRLRLNGQLYLLTL